MIDYRDMVEKIAKDSRSTLNYGESYTISVSLYDNGEMTIMIADYDHSPHYRAFDIDGRGRIVQEWYRERQTDDWLFTE